VHAFESRKLARLAVYDDPAMLAFIGRWLERSAGAAMRAGELFELWKEHCAGGNAISLQRSKKRSAFSSSKTAAAQFKLNEMPTPYRSSGSLSAVPPSLRNAR
jgi:hypothetical protein